MRVMLKIVTDIDKANQAIQSGRMKDIIQNAIRDSKAEASYFMADENGKRTALLFCDLQDSSQLPPIAEPLFFELKAEVTAIPVMNLEELQKGLKAFADAAMAGTR